MFSGKKLSEEELEGMRQAYDAVFARACLECTDVLAADKEVHRMAEAVLSATSLVDQADAYDLLDDNIYNKLRAILSARQKGQRFEVGSIQIGTHVCKRRGRLMICVKVTGKARRSSRQSIEVAIKGAK
jgi:hypothetical protein